MDRLEVLCTSRKSPGANPQYSILVFRGAWDGNPEKKFRAGDDDLRDCLEEYGLEPSVVDDIFCQLKNADSAERCLDAIPA